MDCSPSVSLLAGLLVGLIVFALVMLALDPRARCSSQSMASIHAVQPAEQMHDDPSVPAGRLIYGVGGNRIDLRGSGIEFGMTPKLNADKP